MKLVVVPYVDVESLYAVSERIDDIVFVPLIVDAEIWVATGEVAAATEATFLVVDDEAAVKLADTALVTVVTVVVDVVP